MCHPDRSEAECRDLLLLDHVALNARVIGVLVLHRASQIFPDIHHSLTT